MKVTTLGIDLAKNVFRVHGCDARGKAMVSKTLTRRQLLTFMAQLSPCLVGMEACPTSNYWAPEIQKFGHLVRLMAPRFVKPYVKANNNDTADAEAICEAVRRPTMRFVAVKSIAQQDVQAVHRVRANLVKTRVGLANQVRGLLAEYGIVVAEGFAPLRRALPTILEDERLSSLMREVVGEIAERLRYLEDRLHQYDLRVRGLQQWRRTLPAASAGHRRAHRHRAGRYGR
jgi:transposase